MEIEFNFIENNWGKKPSNLCNEIPIKLLHSDA